MRDYSNIPSLNWESEHAAEKAKAQILHQEPVILQMPDNFDFSLHSDDYECQVREEQGIIYNCDGGEILNHLAELNDAPELRMVAEACIESSSQVDIDSAQHRIIVHD
jgi:hypothetical protein